MYICMKNTSSGKKNHEIISVCKLVKLKSCVGAKDSYFCMYDTLIFLFGNFFKKKKAEKCLSILVSYLQLHETKCNFLFGWGE